MQNRKKIEFTNFVLEKNRDVIDLKVFIIDFDNVKSLDRFLGTFGKILIANVKLGRNASLVNFTGTYQKSRRIFESLGQLFDLVEEKNSKTVTTGSFGYEERLKIFFNR